MVGTGHTLPSVLLPDTAVILQMNMVRVLVVALLGCLLRELGDSWVYHIGRYPLLENVFHAYLHQLFGIWMREDIELFLADSIEGAFRKQLEA
jgi:hypothetical protein